MSHNHDDHLSNCSLVRRRRLPCGTTTIELLVSFTLLTTVLTASLPLAVRHGRILTSARHYRLAIDELSNQFERLTALPAAGVSAELERLEPSPFTAARLPEAELSGTLAAAEMGRRLTLEIVWDEPGRRSAPVRLVGWVLPHSDRAAAEPPAVEGSEP